MPSSAGWHLMASLRSRPRWRDSCADGSARRSPAGPPGRSVRRGSSRSPRAKAGDRRFIKIELTETGKAIAGRAAPQLEQLNRQLLAGFTETEVEQLTSLLKRL